ncbi:MAG TPA: hypothetical protein VGS22_19325 [Thermoanaerobaculia bacterium]|jgi:hypothetical protein|nr:hypothetical protein [Thermoanaerobaculia bacterium]
MKFVAMVFVLAMLSAPPASGQNLQIFDIEDFIDPALLQLLGEGTEAKPFGALSLTTGGAQKLQRWGESIPGVSTFASVAGDLYYRDWQLSADALGVNPSEATPRFGDRFGVQLGRYSSSEISLAGKEGDDERVSRLLMRKSLGVEFEKRPNGTWGHAFIAGLDLRRDGPRKSVLDLVGGLTYTWAEAGPGDEGHPRQYLSFDYRTPIAAFKRDTRIAVGYGYGVEYVGGKFRAGAIQLELSGDLPIPPIGKLRIAWTPAYQINRRAVYDGFAILYVPPSASKIFTRPPWRHHP